MNHREELIRPLVNPFPWCPAFHHVSFLWDGGTRGESKTNSQDERCALSQIGKSASRLLRGVPWSPRGAPLGEPCYGSDSLWTLNLGLDHFSGKQKVWTFGQSTWESSSGPHDLAFNPWHPESPRFCLASPQGPSKDTCQLAPASRSGTTYSELRASTCC